MSEVQMYDEEENLATQTPLQRRYCFWYMRKQKQPTAAYEESIKPIGSFQTVEHFWRLYDHLLKPDHVKQPIEYHLFVDGVKPTWEDPVNAEGGKWRIRLRKGLGSRYWEELVLAIIGEQFAFSDEICGAVISVRAAEDVLSVWTKTADDLEATTNIRDQLRRILHLPANIPMDYKKHQDSIPDKAITKATAIPATAGPRQAPARREWGQAAAPGNLPSVQREGSGDKQGTGSSQWERRHNRGAPPTRETRDASDDRRGHKKPEGDRGWERSRRYQHSTNSNPQPNTTRWSRGLSVPEATANTTNAANAAKPEDAQATVTQA